MSRLTKRSSVRSGWPVVNGRLPPATTVRATATHRFDRSKINGTWPYGLSRVYNAASEIILGNQTDDIPNAIDGTNPRSAQPLFKERTHVLLPSDTYIRGVNVGVGPGFRPVTK